MGEGIYLALGGALGETEKLDVDASNLANAATVGYQRLRPVFHSALQAAEAASAPSISSELDTTPGAMRVTGRPLDVALPGGTYLALSTARGERYTRAGALSIGTGGALQTRSGDKVLSERGQPITTSVDKGEVTISPDAEVFQDGTSLGRLKLVTFASPSRLVQEGAAVLAASTGSGAPTSSSPTIEVGSLEESNTSVVGSMTDLVSATRAFDAFQRAVDAFRDADQKVTSTVPNADQ